MGSRFLSCALIACASLLITAGSAAAQHRVLLEVGPGVAIPVTKYFNVEATDGYARAENSPNAAVGMAVLFGGWTFRYALSSIMVGHAERRFPTGFHEKLSNFMQNIGEQAPPQEGEGNIDEAVSFHSISFGYRFYLTRSRWQPYIPLELGAVFASSEMFDEKTVYGVVAGTGFGLDVQLWKWLWAGLTVRYNFVLTEGIPETAVAGLTSDKPELSAAVNMVHLIGITAQLQARY